MFRRALVLAAVALPVAAVGSAPAFALSMPRVDFGDRPAAAVSLGLDTGLQAGGSIAADVPLSPLLAVGGGLGTSVGGFLNYDLRATYRFVEPDEIGLSVGGIAGLWGAPGTAGFQLPGAVAPFFGFGLAYDITPQFVARLNLAYSPFYTPGRELLGFIGGPPAAGVEVAYRLSPTMEATIGLNGRGDLAGLRLAF